MSNSATFFLVTHFILIGVRILLGPFHPVVVACVYYSMRIGLDFTIYLLTSKAILMTAFVSNFEIMSGKKRHCTQGKDLENGT